MKDLQDHIDDIYDDLGGIIDDMKSVDAQDYLRQIAEIYKNGDRMTDKYADISDIFDKIINYEAIKRFELMNDS